MKTIEKNIVIPSTLIQTKNVTLAFLIMASLTFFVVSNSNLQFASAHKSADAPHLDFIKQFGTPGGDDARGVFVDSSGDVYVVGITGGTLPDQTSEGGEFDAFILKYNSDGDEIWTRQFGTSDFDTAIEVTGDSSGGVYVVGNTNGEFPGQTNVGGSDSFIRKYNPDGDEIWTRQFGTSGGVSATGVSADSSGGVYVVGGTGDTFPGQTSEGGGDAYIRKYNSDGDEIWTRQFGTSGVTEGNAVFADSSAGVYVVGLVDGTLPDQTSEGGEFDAFILKYNSDGDEIWTRQFGTSGSDVANRVSADSSGGAYVVGSTTGTFPSQTSEGGQDAFLAKFSNDDHNKKHHDDDHKKKH
ncbi:MAG TPA: SBBP repeat-containing protein [Nitrososphaera sp.]